MKQTDLPLDSTTPPEAELPSVTAGREMPMPTPENVLAPSLEDVETVEPSQGEEILMPLGAASSRFFPCNREDALLLLGSLCISEYFSDRSVKLAVQPDGIALLEDGLRNEEIDLLIAGRVERFPILVEVLAAVADRKNRIIGYSDILGLVFRSQGEADDFRFRPVDEFDTDTFATRVDSSRFHLEGAPRFSLRPDAAHAILDIGSISDRLATGVQKLLSLGSARPACRPAIVRFLKRPSDTSLDSEEVDFYAAANVLTGPAYSSITRHQRAIVTAFARSEFESGGALVDAVMKQLALLPESDGSQSKIENKWADVARDVVRSRIALTGDLVSDDRSVLLRAALLSLVADRPGALFAFMDAEKPAGPRVITTSAFLIGLKQGLLNLSWTDKKAYASELSYIAGITLSALANGDGNVGEMFLIERREDDATSVIVISAGGVILAEWIEAKKPDALAQEWINQMGSLDYQIVGPGRSKYSWMVKFSITREVEIVHCVAGSFIFPTMKFYFADGEKLRKPKELIAAFFNREMFWYPCTDGEGKAFLSCDMTTLPDRNGRELLALKLEEAISACIVPKKTPKKLRK